MSGLVRVPLEDGGWFLVRAGSADAEEPADGSGPVRAGRVGDRLGRGAVEAAETLESALAPVISMSQAVLTALAKAAPREVEVEFGVELTAEAGAVVSKAGGGCHLTVTLTWARDEAGQDL